MIKARKWNARARYTGLAVALAVSATCPLRLDAAEGESFPVDSPRWQLGPKAKITDYLGRRCLALEDDVATLKDFEMAYGIIDVDMASTGARGRRVAPLACVNQPANSQADFAIAFK